MSKHAYEKGVVLIKCDGCSNTHLIADHLGWFDSQKGPIGTIEDIMKEKGESVKRLSFNSNNQVYIPNNTDDGKNINEILAENDDHGILQLVENPKKK